jgi:hypothetical protein
MKWLRAVPYLLLIGYVGAATVGMFGLLALRSDGGVGPEQPIAFSHQIHAADLALDCTHCHQTVEVSRHPGIPSTEVCMVCHAMVATDRPDIQRLTRIHNEGREVEWLKIHEMPWHVYFSHKRHVKAGVDCTACHGDVTVQLPVRQVRSLKMGMCVNCHRAYGAPIDCWICHK